MKFRKQAPFYPTSTISFYKKPTRNQTRAKDTKKNTNNRDTEKNTTNKSEEKNTNNKETNKDTLKQDRAVTPKIIKNKKQAPNKKGNQKMKKNPHRVPKTIIDFSKKTSHKGERLDSSFDELDFITKKGSGSGTASGSSSDSNSDTGSDSDSD